MRSLKFLIIVAILAALVFGGIGIYRANQQRVREAAAKVLAEKKAAEERAATARINNVQQRLNSVISGSNVSTSVSVIDLKSGKSTQAGLDVIFRAASTTKVLSVAAYMHEVEQGNATLDTLVSGTKAQTLLERMLRKSDNNAWAAINKYIGTSELVAYAESIGITSYGPSQNTIDSNDMALLLQKLHDNELMNKAHTQLVLSFMQNTNNEDLIPPALPEGATVHHKFGLYEGELHDAGIIEYQGRSFVLVIFTNNEADTLSDGATRIELIHELTTAAVEGMTKSGGSTES
jgi:beta-lactamase class A